MNSITPIGSTGSSGGPAASAGAAKGMAEQFVAQSTAMTVQDASDFLRAVETISVAAIGTVTAMIVKNPAEVAVYAPVLAAVQENLAMSATYYGTVGTTAAGVLGDFGS